EGVKTRWAVSQTRALAPPRGRNARARRKAALDRRRGACPILESHGGHLDLKIDTVEQRARQAAEIACDRRRGADASSARMAAPAARAGVCRSDQEKARRIFERVAR